MFMHSAFFDKVSKNPSYLKVIPLYLSTCRMQAQTFHKGLQHG